MSRQLTTCCLTVPSTLGFVLHATSGWSADDSQGRRLPNPFFAMNLERADPMLAASWTAQAELLRELGYDGAIWSAAGRYTGTHANLHVHLLPYLEQDHVYQAINWNRCSGTPQNDPHRPWTRGDNSTTDTAAARSMHSGGLNAIMADGCCRFVNDTINMAAWRALATIAGNETNTGGH